MDVVLVHGMYQGAWCWERLVPELVRRGHRPRTVELPVSDPGLGASDYARIVAAAVDPAAETALVGHSMAGLVIPLVPGHVPVARLVYLAALLPDPGRSANDQRESEPIEGHYTPRHDEWTDLGDDVWMMGPKLATELFFHDVPSDVTAWALRRLRPQAYRVLGEPTPLSAWPSVPAHSIVCRADRVVSAAWGKETAQRRLGVEAVELEGGHAPYLARPSILAQAIDAAISHAQPVPS